ncbi:MAG: hypothetical protein LC808_19045 [Actinobacteria bacterium]|nr:hypothetical protein [Actinomycetota bacterium]
MSNQDCHDNDDYPDPNYFVVKAPGVTITVEPERFEVETRGLKHPVGATGFSEPSGTAPRDPPASPSTVLLPLVDDRRTYRAASAHAE